MIAAFALALSAGTAAAQDDEWSDEGGDVCGGDVCGGDEGVTDEGGGEGAATEGGEEGGGETAAPAEGAAAAGPAAGQIKAGATVLVPSGIDENGEIGIGGWIELRPWASYQVNDKIKAGVMLPLLVVTPDFGDNGPELLQGVMAGANYAVNDKITANVDVGLARPARMLINPFGGIGAPGGAGDMKMGFGFGADYVHKMDKIKVVAGAKVLMQLDSGVDDMGEAKMGMAAHVPVMAAYDVNEKLTAAVATGIYTGDEFKFSADDGMTLPFVAGAKYAVNEQIAAGGFVGFSSVVVPEGLGVGDTMTLGLFASWTK